jgi:hypothetical protein
MSGWLGFIELIFVFGIVLALSLRELWSVRRGAKDPSDKSQDEG